MEVESTNFCKQCGKEVLEKKKSFCNSSCSAKYNNIRRIRKPWTEKQKLRVRTERVIQQCKYCGEKTGKLVYRRFELGICETCKPFAGQQKTLQKIEGKNLAEKYTTLSQKLCEMYFEDKMSIPKIAKETGLWFLQIEKILNNSGKILRSLSESQKNAFFQGDKTIPFPKRSIYKHGKYVTWEGKSIYYRSSYELEYALQLDEQQISYNVENLKIEYFDTQKGKTRIAVPDFHLPEMNEIVEIKSSYTYDEQNMRDKFKAYEEAGYTPRLFINKKEVFLSEG